LDESSELDHWSESEQIAAVACDYDNVGRISNPSETVQLAAVAANGFAIKFIKNPCEAAQLASVSKVGSAIRYIENPSNKVILIALKQPNFIRRRDDYAMIVKDLFKDNTILINKWLRYAEMVRNQE
jgi:hypothetical protein